MKKCKFLGILLFCCAMGFSQTTNRVGINTSTPGETLDVNGNISIRDVDVADVKSDNYEQLYWNIKTKKIEVANNDRTEKPFYAVSYSLKANDDSNRDFADYIKDFDTKVNADNYYMIMTQAYPVIKKEAYYSGRQDYIGIRHVEIGDETELKGVSDYETGKNSGQGSSDVNNKVNPIRKTAIFVKDGTWRISLDYLAARPASWWGGSRRMTFDWKVEVLFISKSFAENIDFGTKGLNRPYQGKGEMGENPLLMK